MHELVDANFQEKSPGVNIWDITGWLKIILSYCDFCCFVRTIMSSFCAYVIHTAECVTDLDYQSEMIIFGSILTTFEFGGSWGSIENWLKPKT